MGDETTTLYALDSAYQPFPSFSAWAERTTVDSTRWNRYLALLDTENFSAEVLKRARQIAKRAAAIDTGAIEGLYEVDRGFTYTVAFEAAAWETALAEKGEEVRSLFEAQLHAYDYVLDLATKAEPISEAAIRFLHVEICRPQGTYRVMTSIGPQEQPLPKGEYKVAPNHVRTRKGTDHSYAPVDVTPAEMARFVAELRTDQFVAAHPMIQAAYAHYAFVVIHPFADGNGRVARALASVFTYRAMSMPVVILAEHKNVYLDSLESADQGNYQSFVEFIHARALDTIKLVEESVRSLPAPAPEDSIAAIKRLYVTRGGYTHEQVDSAGVNLVDAAVREVQRVLAMFVASPMTSNVGSTGLGYGPSSPSYRLPLHGGRGVIVSIGTPAPATAAVNRPYALELPRDAGGDDDIVLRNHQTGEVFTARMDEVFPVMSGVLQIRLGIFAERIVGEMLADLSKSAEQALRGR